LYEHDYGERWHNNLLQRLGQGPSRHVFAWLAAMFRRLGRPNALAGSERIPRCGARPAGPWPIQPSLVRERMDGYADDLASLMEALDLKDVTLVGHSTGGGEVTRYIGRHGTKRVAAAILIGAVPPILVNSASNPEGIPIEVFDGLRSGLAKDRSQFWKDFAITFYGANRPGANVSQGMLDQFWLWSMQAGLKNVYDSIKAFSETDFHEDLKKFDVPTLIMHGEDDQIVPINISGKRSAKLIKGAKEIFYPGLPHGLTATNADQVNADLLKFLKSVQQVRKAA
jgi:non-heme chloroperoxidase